MLPKLAVAPVGRYVRIVTPSSVSVAPGVPLTLICVVLATVASTEVVQDGTVRLVFAPSTKMFPAASRDMV